MKIRTAILTLVVLQGAAFSAYGRSGNETKSYLLPWALIAEKFGDESRFYSDVKSGNWKKGILAFCRGLKEEIEANPDPQLIHSSISVSHFDHTMEVISKASVLSEEVLKNLREAIKSKQDFDAGRCPDLVIGLNKVRLKRFEGARVAEFAISIPDNYDDSKSWPMLLYTDPRRRGTGMNYKNLTGIIELWWHFPMPLGYEWKDYEYLLKVLNERINLNEDRIYVNGICGNGVAAVALALNYPDLWAECSVTMGNSYRHLTGNAFNLPLVFVIGGHHQEHLVAYYDFAVQCFKYYGCRHFRHSKTQSINQVRGSSLPEAVRRKNPQRVLYTIESLANPKSYWVKIDGRKDENFTATIDAIVWGQSILLKTKNIDAYSLDLTLAPVDANRPVEIIENGQNLGFAAGRVFTRKSEKYKDALYIKNEYLHGPVWDVFTDPYVVIWGTGGKDNEAAKANERTAISLANGAPCFADVNMANEFINSRNMILVGTAESNLWLSKISEKLPVNVKKGRLIADGVSYGGRNMGVILIYPNPLNSERYVAVFSGTSQKTMANISEVYAQMKSKKPADVGIFEVTEEGEIKWHRIEKFNTVWDWHDQWNRVLAETNKEHPKWQWSQWVAKVLREEFESDVVISEDPFQSSDLLPRGPITYRDLCNSFRNDWMVKIMLDGKSLRNLLMVPFSDASERKVSAPVIDGVSLLKSQNRSAGKVLGINELQHSKEYTVALPYKAVNGQRMGLVIKDYKIVGEGRLVCLLKDYLLKNKSLDIDASLDSLKFNMF